MDKQAAIGIIVNDRKVLLGKRTAYKPDYAHCWDYIGGRIEQGETPVQTLAREMREELGISPRHMIFVDQYVDHSLNADSPPLYHFYVVTAWDGGVPRVANHEHSEIGWFDLKEMRVLRNLADRAYIDLADRALAIS